MIMVNPSIQVPYEIRVHMLLRIWITIRVVFPQIHNFNGMVQNPRHNEGERQRDM